MCTRNWGKSLEENHNLPIFINSSNCPQCSSAPLLHTIIAHSAEIAMENRKYR